MAGKAVTSLIDLVGNTPLIEIAGYEKKNGLGAKIFGKLEYFNPTGSVKDRIVKEMILEAEKEGKLKPGDTILDNTSGNTGISLAAFGKSRGYNVVIAIEPGVTVERSQMLRAHGAELRDFAEIPGVIEAMSRPDATFQTLLEPMEAYGKEKGYYYINQCSNEANVKAHYEHTAPEIWEQMEGKVDIFVAMSGTGGTITGAGKYLKEKNPDVKIVLVQPDANSLPAPGKTEPKIDGIMLVDGVPEDMAPFFYKRHGFNYDEVITVSGEEAYETAREIAVTDGLFVGESSAGTITAAKKLAQRPENAGKNIVAMVADGGLKYLSTSMFKKE